MINDSKLIELSCKEVLMSIVRESETIDKKLSFFQKTLLYDKIREMKYETVISVLFNEGKEITTEQKREFESKTKKIAKYGAAGYVGRKVGLRAVGGAPIKVLGKTVVKGRGGHGDALGLMAGGERKVGKLGTKGGIRGALTAVAGLYLYRKLSDPCARKNMGNPQGQAACRMAAIKKVIGQIKNDMNKCNSTNSPEKCKGKLSKELVKWQAKYQKLLVTYNKDKKNG